MRASLVNWYRAADVSIARRESVGPGRPHGNRLVAPVCGETSPTGRSKTWRSPQSAGRSERTRSGRQAPAAHPVELAEARGRVQHALASGPRAAAKVFVQNLVALEVHR